MTFFDTAEVYGPFTNEELLGRALEGRRDRAVIATKFGWEIEVATSRGASTAGRRTSARRSRARSGGSAPTTSTCCTSTGSIPQVPIEDVVGAMADLVSEGKVRFLGLSEAGERPSAAPMRCIRSRRSRANTRCGSGT